MASSTIKNVIKKVTNTLTTDSNGYADTGLKRSDCILGYYCATNGVYVAHTYHSSGSPLYCKLMVTDGSVWANKTESVTFIYTEL